MNDQIEEENGGTPNPQEVTPLQKFNKFLKDTKEIIIAISAIVAAIFFALNYFASQAELNCLKAESSQNDEFVNTILRINELSAIWQLESATLDRMNQKRARAVKNGEELSDEDTQKFFQVKANVDDREAELAAARKRRSELEANDVKCD